MATAVLRSHDPLKDSSHLNAFRSRPPQPPMKPPRRKPTRPPHRSLPKPAGRKATFADKENAMVVKAPSRNLVMEEVTILKRGDDPRGALSRLDSALPEAKDEVLPFFSTDRMGPDPEILPKKIGLSEKRPAYAGPGFVASSPSPSSLPFPALFLKKAVHGVEAVATKNLRCLLRIDALP